MFICPKLKPSHCDIHFPVEWFGSEKKSSCLNKPHDGCILTGVHQQNVVVQDAYFALFIKLIAIYFASGGF